MRSNGWKIPFNIALGIHILVLVGSVYLPAIFKSKPKFADVYSVSLVNIAEPEPAPPVKDPGPPKVAKQPPPPPATPPKVKKEVTPVEAPPKVVEKVETPEPMKEEPQAETPAPPKAVSLKPLKQKKVKVVKEVIPPKPEVDRREIQKLAEALKEEEILAEKARLAREALEQERKLLAKSLKASEAMASSSPAAERPANAAASTASGSSTLLEARYHSEILGHISRFWSVPEYMAKDLLSVVVITIRQDGDVTTMEFESKSGDRMYDQFVIKALEAAKPLPPIPPAMKKETYEIGLKFRPGSVQ